MRQPPGTGDTLHIELIDVIDAEPSAFGGAAGGSWRAPEHRTRPRWLVPVVLTAATATVLGVIAWQPWDVPTQWRMFTAPAPTVAELSNLLLPADPPGLVTAVVEPGTVGSNEPTSSLGYVVAEPGATMSTGRSARFEATPTGAADAARLDDAGRADQPTVHGVAVTLEQFQLRHELEWGPLDGHNWRALTVGMDAQESVAFAGAAGIADGRAALRYDYPLDAMVPLGSASAFNSVYSLHNEVTGGHLSSDLSPTMVTYTLDDERPPTRIASVPAPPDAMQLVEYVFGDGSATTVHGLPARQIDSPDVGPMIIWLEGGRLITVIGRQTDEPLLAIAESVTAVTADEWLNAVSPMLEFYIPVTTWPEDSSPIDVGSGVTSAGVPWRVSITIGNPTVTCVYVGDLAATADEPGQSMCTFSTPRVPATRQFMGAFPGITFVVAIVPIEEYRLVLRVTSADGTITDHQPVQLNEQYTGVAAAIDTDASYELVDPSI